MAYAALNSLSQVIEQTLNIHDQYSSFKKVNLLSLQENVCSLLAFLDDHSFLEVTSRLQGRIIDVAYQAEDIIESDFTPLTLSASEDKCHSLLRFTFEKILFCFSISNNRCGLHRVLQEIHVILEELMALKNDRSTKNASTVAVAEGSGSASSSILDTEDDGNIMVGFDGNHSNDDFMVIKNRIYRKSYALEVIPIVGMGGIGKSTLARKMYEDSLRGQHFDRCAWITVSHEYSRAKLLSRILLCVSKFTGDVYQKSEVELVELVYKELFGRRFLIVVDDVWSVKAWDDLNVIFPKQSTRSRVLVTTRLSHVAAYVGTTSSPPHEMHFFSADQNWSLIKERVFEKGSCPSMLEKIGHTIAQNCHGLPLTAAVVAGLLKGNITEKYWITISQNISSTEPTIALQCSKVLSLSYEFLPLHLKPCFLYVSAFPEDKEIKANRLIKLWMAEGFVKPSRSKRIEEDAEAYLDDLVERSLLIVSKRRYNGRIKTVRIHDLLRDIGTLKSREERFHNHDVMGSLEGIKRRLSIHLHNSLGHLEGICDRTTRSLLIFTPVSLRGTYTYRSFPIRNLWLLRILDAPDAPIVVHAENLVHLRYLAFEVTDPDFPKSVSKLRNLQTLIIKGYLTSVPLEVWSIPSLRHLTTAALPYSCILEQPSEDENVEETNLQTLTLATNLELSMQTVKMLANLRKLGLYYPGKDQKSWENFKLGNLVHLEYLEDFKIVFAGHQTVPGLLSVELAFPPNLKKLTLHNVQCLWEDMSIIGSLQYLEVLKLRRQVATDRVWDPIEDQFPALRYLELDGVQLDFWGADSTHFPSLEILVLKDIASYQLQIPDTFGEINTLKLIKLCYCDSSLTRSCEEVIAEQRKMGNDDLQLIVINRSFKENMRINLQTFGAALRFIEKGSRSSLNNPDSESTSGA